MTFITERTARFFFPSTMMEEKRQILPSSEALAYLGDAVYSLFIREMLVARGVSHAGELNRLALLYVTAEAQSAHVRRIMERLTEYERDIYHRAYNHKGLKAPKHAHIAEYRAASGLEALVGALYLEGNKERIKELLGDVEPLAAKA